MPSVKPYSRSAACFSAPGVAEHRADLGAAAEQVRGLAADDVEVLVFADVEVAVLGQLVDLALDHPQRDVAQQPHDVERVLGERHRHRLDVEEVAGQHGDVVAPARVHGLLAAAQLGVVDDVVVDEGGGVDELHHGGVQHRAAAGVAAQPRRHQQHRRPHPLAAALLDVGANLGDDADLRLDLRASTRARPRRGRRGWARTAGSDRESSSTRKGPNPTIRP